jgi:hypothetical protein
LLTVLREDLDDMLRTGEAAERLLVEHGRIDRQVQLLMSMGYECLSRNAPGAARPLTRRALAIAEQRDHPVGLALAWGNEGLAALLDGDDAAAEVALRKELELAGELRLASLISEALQGLAALAAARQEDDLATILRAAGTAMQTHPDPVLDERLDRWFTPCRERLGGDRWVELVQQGSRLSMEQAVALATTDPAINAPM